MCCVDMQVNLHLIGSLTFFLRYAIPSFASNNETIYTKLCKCKTPAALWAQCIKVKSHNKALKKATKLCCVVSEVTFIL